jgi:hypothetical protein
MRRRVEARGQCSESDEPLADAALHRDTFVPAAIRS